MARPTEIRAVAAAISEPAATAEEAAKRAITALDEARRDRTDYAVVTRMGRMVQAYGPFATENQAAKAIEGQKIPAIDGTSFYVFPLYHPRRGELAIEKADVSPISEAAQKCWEIARNGGQAARASTRRNRRNMNRS